MWRLEGPEGQRQIRVKGNIRSNSAELIRESLLSGIGLGLRGTWEIGPEIKSGALQVVLPQYRGASSMAIYAVYPCRDFMPTKVNAFIEYIAEHFSLEPYWEKGLGLDTSKKAADQRQVRGPLGRQEGQRSRLARTHPNNDFSAGTAGSGSGPDESLVRSSLLCWVTHLDGSGLADLYPSIVNHG